MNKEFEIVNKNEFNSNQCLNTIKVETSYACGIVKNDLFALAGKYKWLAVCFVLVLGLFFLFFGNSYFNTSAVIILAVITSYIFNNFNNTYHFGLPYYSII